MSSKTAVKRDIISSLEISEYLWHKQQLEALHDNIVSRLERGALCSNESQVELFLVNAAYKKVDWKSVAKRLAKRIYKDKVGAYLHGLIVRAKTINQTKLCNRNNALYIPPAAREAQPQEVAR